MLIWEHKNLVSGIKVIIQMICYFNSKCKKEIKLWGRPELEQYIAYRSSNATPHKDISETEIVNGKQINIVVFPRLVKSN